MPRFLERDEAEREPPCPEYPWDGVRNVRPFSRLPGARGGGRVLMLHIPVLRRGPAVPQPRGGARSPHSPLARAVRRGEPGQRRPHPPRPRGTRPRCARRCGRCPTADLLERCRRAADLFADGDAARGRRGAAPGGLRRAGLGHHRPAPRPRAPQHARRSRACCAGMPAVLAGLTRGLDLGVLDHGRGEADGHAVSFTPARRRARRRAAQQLAGRALAVGARDRPEDGAGPEAGQRGAVDAVPADPGLPRRGRAARTPSATTRPTTRARRRSCARCGRGMVFGDTLDDVGVGRRPAGRGPRPGLQQGRARARRQPRLPARTSTSWWRRSPRTRAAPASTPPGCG